MHRQWLWLGWLCSVLVLLPAQAFSCAEPVSDARFDLTCLSEDQPVIALQGLWQLQYASAADGYQFSGLTEVPGVWRALPGNDAKHFSGQGLYELTLHGAPPAEPLSVLLPLSWSARKIYLIQPTGERRVVFSAQPKTAQAPLASTPVLHVPVPLPSVQSGARLQIEMTAIDSRFSGLWAAPKIGFTTALTAQQTGNKLFATLQSATLFVLTLLVLYMWHFFRGNFSLLLLAVASAAMVVRLLANAGVLTDIWPMITVRAQVLISWGTYLLGSAAIIAFFQRRFPQSIPVYLVAIPIVSNMLGLIILVLAGTSAIQAYAMFARPVVILSLLLIFVHLMVKSDWRSSDAVVTLIGLFLMNIGLVVELVYYQIYGDELPFSLNGGTLTLFMVSQAYLLSRHFLHAVRKNVELRDELAGINASLEDKIAERTRELREQNRLLEQKSTTDELTGLANRWQINLFANRHLQALADNGVPLTLILIDLDFFKQVNDRYGHNAGDQVLKEFAQLLISFTRDGDLPGRWGGEEFCVLAPNLSEQAALNVAERLLQFLSEHVYELAEGPLKMTASIGVATAVQATTFRLLTQKADTALYRAKRLGRNRVCRFDPKSPAF